MHKGQVVVGSIGGAMFASFLTTAQMYYSTPTPTRSDFVFRLMMGSAISCAVCVCIWLYLHFVADKKPRSEGQYQKARDVSGKMFQAEHLHYHEAPHVAPVAPPAPSKPAQPTHNVVFLGASFIKITYSGPGFSDRTDGMHSFSEVQGNSSGDMIGLVARFRNEAIYGQHVNPVNGARAHLKLFDANNQEIGTGFSSALWMGHSTDTFDLIPNGTGGSVLVYWGSSDPKSTVKAVVCWKTGDARVRLRDKDIYLNEHPRRAEVTIMDCAHRPLLKPVILEIATTAGNLSVSATQ